MCWPGIDNWSGHTQCTLYKRCPGRARQPAYRAGKSGTPGSNYRGRNKQSHIGKAIERRETTRATERGTTTKDYRATPRARDRRTTTRDHRARRATTRDSPYYAPHAFQEKSAARAWIAGIRGGDEDEGTVSIGPCCAP